MMLVPLDRSSAADVGMPAAVQAALLGKHISVAAGKAAEAVDETASIAEQR